VFLVIVGVGLILFGVVSTPVYQPLGNASFWLGVLLEIIGIGTIVLGLG
jgi:hypothetical protein